VSNGNETVIESAALRVRVDPLVGGTITAIEHKGLGASVLGTVPWPTKAGPAETWAAPDETVWLPYYGGGWPILFPNGGDACDFAGTFHGFHGEASLAPWDAEVDGASLRLTRRFAAVPVEMDREMTVAGELLTIRETLRMQGGQPIRVMWGHHPTFGSDLLAGPFEIQSGARGIIVDAGFDSETNPLRPGAGGRWPMVPGKRGSFDLSRPTGTLATMTYLHDFAAPWASIRRLDDFVAAALSWDAAVFPCAWLWCELGGTAAAPWGGKARLIGIEPNTTRTGGGLAEADRRGERLMILEPGATIRTTVRLHVFRPTGALRGVDASGHAILGDA